MVHRDDAFVATNLRRENAKDGVAIPKSQRYLPPTKREAIVPRLASPPFKRGVATPTFERLFK